MNIFTDDPESRSRRPAWACPLRASVCPCRPECPPSSAGSTLTMSPTRWGSSPSSAGPLGVSGRERHRIPHRPRYARLLLRHRRLILGLVRAGWQVKLAADHDKTAIATHSANHPDTEHICADLRAVDFRYLPKTRALWASPICTEDIPGRGQKKQQAQGGRRCSRSTATFRTPLSSGRASRSGRCCGQPGYTATR